VKKIEGFLANHTYSAICFMFSLILVFITCILGIDYFIYKEINESDLSSINYVEGKVSKIQDLKSNIDIYIEENDKEFYIHKKDIKDIEIKEGDYLVIYYADNNPFRNEYYRIVNLEVNNLLVYSLSDFKKTLNLNLQLAATIGSAVVSISLILVGLILMKRNKPVDDVRQYVLSHREEYDLTLEEAEDIISQFENTEPELDRPKEEVYELFKNAIYVKNGRTYTSALELVTNPAYDDIFFEVLADLVDEKEFKVIYDDSVRDDSEIYLLYKINNKTAVINMFINEETIRFDVDEETLFFMFEEDMEPNKNEIASFMEEVRKYNMFIENIFMIKGD